MCHFYVSCVSVCVCSSTGDPSAAAMAANAVAAATGAAPPPVFDFATAFLQPAIYLMPAPKKITKVEKGEGDVDGEQGVCVC